MRSEYIQVGGIVIVWLVALYLIISYHSNKSKNKFKGYLPHDKKNLLASLTNNPTIKAQLFDITTANGKTDSVEALLKDITQSLLYSAILLVVALIFKGYMALLCLVGITLLIINPITSRISRKKSFRKQYISNFYEFLNYITLYLSGGIEFKQALNEVYNLLPDHNLLKPKIKEIMTRNVISGLSGDSYIQTLELLNEGLDYSEINSFISSAKRSQEKGDAISETLLIQMVDISKKMKIEKIDYITRRENAFGAMKVGLCFVPYLLITIVPIFWAVLKTLSMGMAM